MTATNDAPNTPQVANAVSVGSTDLMGVYEYFVSYKIANGYGRCAMYRQKPIATIDDVAEIEAAIVEDQKKAGTWNAEQGKLCIMNWQRFDTPIDKLCHGVAERKQ